MKKNNARQSKKILITGIAGFIGSHLADYAIQHQWRVFGIKRKEDNAAHLAPHAKKINPALSSRDITRREKNLTTSGKGGIKLFNGDVADKTLVTSILKRVRPDIIFHLASLITPRNERGAKQSTLTPEKILLANVKMAMSILESVRALNERYEYNPVIILMGSAEEYGKISRNNLPIKESLRLRPVTHYASSKAIQELLGKTYAEIFGLNAILVRLFNQHGPRQQATIVPAAFAKQVAAIEAKMQEPVIWHGNLNAKRDFTDARDTVRALMLLAKKAKSDKRVIGTPFNIASGKKHFYSVKQILALLCAMSRVPIQTRPDPKRMRKAEIPLVLGSYEKLCKATGWHPRIPVKKTLRDSLNYWRMQYKKPR